MNLTQGARWIAQTLQPDAKYALHGRYHMPMASVQRQIQAVRARQWLKAPAQGVPRGEQNQARTSSSTVGDATRKTAFWLALLARVERAPGMLAPIQAMMGRAQSNETNPAAVERVFLAGAALAGGYRTPAGRYVQATLTSLAGQVAGVRARTAREGGIVERAAVAVVGGATRLPGALAAHAAEEEARAARQRQILFMVGAGVAVVAGLSWSAQRRRSRDE